MYQYRSHQRQGRTEKDFADSACNCGSTEAHDRSRGRQFIWIRGEKMAEEKALVFDTGIDKSGLEKGLAEIE